MAVAMKCHYEVLGIARDAVDDDIKKAYRKLALKWHPDKNLDNPEQAKEQFQLVQQAWEILSDSHERAWYDKHREAILRGCRGENYKDNAVDLFQYFSNACYKGYGDNDKGFYTVYRNVFEKLAAEDAEFTEDESDYQVPGFGDSQSPYEDVVHEFYAYWQSYSTKRSYVWLDPYDLRDKPNRRVLRIVEKENRKVREKARRERNEQVRNLVAFVRKRDKRAQAYAAKLAERNREKLRKMEERKRAQLLERQKHLREHTESEWSKFSNIEEELKKIEASRAMEFGEELLSDDNGSNDNSFVYGDTFYCVACNKIFKTCKAFTNHENSRKHKENVNALKASMVKSDEDSNSDISSRESNSTAESISFNEPQLATSSQIPDFLLNSSSDKNNDNDNSEEFVSPDELISDDEEKRECSRPTSEKKRLNGGNISPILVVEPQIDTDSSVSVKENTDGDVTSEDELISDGEEDITSSHQKKKKIKRKRNVQNPYPILSRVSDDDTESINEDSLLSKKQRKKLQQRKTAVMNKLARNHKEKQMIEGENEITAARLSDADKDVANAVNQKFLRIDKAMKSRRERKEEKSKKESTVNIDDLAHCCISCSSKFSSKNKLFEHLKKTGHSVSVPAGTQKLKKSRQTCPERQF